MGGNFPRGLTLDDAVKRYGAHRFTMEYVPEWALERRIDGKYYAPQFRSDWEWYQNTLFPEDGVAFVFCNKQTWPLGEELNEPYQKPAWWKVNSFEETSN